MINVGFTGTRHGMSPAQVDAVTMIMRKIADVDCAVTAHHGDCVGADEDFHTIARSVGAVVETHPGPSTAGSVLVRAFCDADRMHDQLEYLTRNRKIVGISMVMIATPFEPTHRDRGGTWYTVDHALKQRKPLALVLPRSGGAVIEFSRWKWPDLPKEMTK